MIEFARFAMGFEAERLTAEKVLKMHFKPLEEFQISMCCDFGLVSDRMTGFAILVGALYRSLCCCE